MISFLLKSDYNEKVIAKIQRCSNLMKHCIYIYSLSKMRFFHSDHITNLMWSDPVPKLSSPQSESRPASIRLPKNFHPVGTSNISTPLSLATLKP